MTTIKNIADRLGVSVGTVSKGLNGAKDISESLRQKIIDTAIEMDYTIKRTQNEDYRKLAVFIERLEYEAKDDFAYDIVLGFKQNAIAHKWSVDIIRVTPDFQSKIRYDTYMLKSGYTGSFLIGFSLTDAWIKQLETTKVPTVMFDTYIRKNPKVCYIGVDNYEGINLAVDHLIGLGHEKIALISDTGLSAVSGERFEAFQNSMSHHGLELADGMIAKDYIYNDPVDSYVSDFLKRGATAIMCGNDMIAANVILTCIKSGYNVPEDISVVGFDDIPIASSLSPSITTISQSRRSVGKCGYVVLDSIINNFAIAKTLMRPQLIVRESTAGVNTLERIRI